MKKSPLMTEYAPTVKSRFSRQQARNFNPVNKRYKINFTAHTLLDFSLSNTNMILQINLKWKGNNLNT